MSEVLDSVSSERREKWGRAERKRERDAGRERYGGESERGRERETETHTQRQRNRETERIPCSLGPGLDRKEEYFQ